MPADDLNAKIKAEGEMIRKTLPAEIKAINEETRTLIAVASTESVDRHGDIIRSKGWELDNFLKNPVIPWAHKYYEPPVAKALRVWVEKKRLMMEIQFATAEEYDFADRIFRLYKGGYLRAFSVGFKSLESKHMYDENERYRGTEFLRQELYEISCVVVPANPQALAKMQEKGLISAEEAQFMEALEKAAGYEQDTPDDEQKAAENGQGQPEEAKEAPENGQEPDLAAQVKELIEQVASQSETIEALENELTQTRAQLGELEKKLQPQPETKTPDAAQLLAAIRENQKTQAENDEDNEVEPETVTKLVQVLTERGARNQVDQIISKRINHHLGVVSE